MKSVLLALTALLFFGTASFSQEVKDFRLVNVVDNQSVSLSSYPSCEGILLIFTSNNCPFDEHYRNRIIRLAEAYAGRVPVLLINAHAEPQESVEKMASKAKALNLTIPYLADKEQVVSSQLGIKKSPEAILLQNSNGKFRVVYRGAIDDNAQVEEDVRHHYLRDAIDIMLARQTIQTPEVRPVGCNLRRKI